MIKMVEKLSYMIEEQLTFSCPLVILMEGAPWKHSVQPFKVEKHFSSLLNGWFAMLWLETQKNDYDYGNA